MDIARDIEAYLFMRGGSIEKSELCELFSISEEKLADALSHLTTEDKERGIVLVDTNDSVELKTAKESEERLTLLRKEELNKDIGRASLEVLSIILYRGPSTRSEVDRIRGVNSTTAVRNLLLRGLLDRVTNPKDERQHLYRPTTDALAHLGVRRLSDLPDYEETKKQIALLEEKIFSKTSDTTS